MTRPAVQKDISPDPDDETLIARIAAGDKCAFRQFVDRYTAFVFALTYRMLSNRQEAEDMAQETFLRVWSRAGSWSPEKGAAVRTWLARIASNLCIDLYRKNVRTKTAPLPDDVTDGAQNAHEMLERKQAGERIGKALQTLPERQRAALVLFHYERMSLAEIGEILSTSAKGTENLLYRARKGLKKALLRQQGGEP